MTIILPEVFVSNAKSAASVSKELKKGRLRKLGSRVYSTNLKEAPAVLIRRHVWFIVQKLFPHSLIADRTALKNRPSAEGAVFLISNKKRPL